MLTKAVLGVAAIKGLALIATALLLARASRGHRDGELQAPEADG